MDTKKVSTEVEPGGNEQSRRINTPVARISQKPEPPMAEWPPKPPPVFAGGTPAWRMRTAVLMRKRVSRRRPQSSVYR